MGNTLVSFAPSAIHSVDDYLAALPDISKEQNLGSTRFLKTVKVRYTNGQYPLVAKVFVIHDNSLPLHYHQKNIEKIKIALDHCPNALPFSKSIILEKSAILLRQYVKYSLYDRVSTRPFLAPSEKKWIAFQLLCALAQCHRAEVCHGDVKLENILVTGWNWVVLTDFASFKPTMLPVDNPTDFFYFFDTSRRQVCCVAPERFYKHKTHTEGDGMLEEPKGKLTPAMDIFSLGCVLIELFTDGKFPFKLSDLYKYKEEEIDQPPQLQEIKDEGIRELCTHMIQRDPAKRLSADKYLEMAREKNIFPRCFFNGLLDYLKLYALDSAHPDSQMFRLFKDHEAFLQKIERCPEGVLALVNFITAMLRSLRHSTAKLTALKLINVCSAKLSPIVILERLLPFMLHMLGDPSCSVVSEAIGVLAESLEHIEHAPKADSIVFPEYILPKIQKVATDPNTVVRLALAANLGSLAESALRFLETSHLNCGDASREDVGNLLQYRASYETELSILHDSVQHIVATLISDNCNQVKRMLLEKGATRLCVFFGQERAHDVLLSHMITFLNDSADHQLRSSFYDSVSGVAAFVGTTVTPILMPLIEQGFNDPHDSVVCSALSCVTALTEIRFFRRGTLCELFTLALKLLDHRNTWIRVEAAHFLACVARNVPLAIKECRLRPSLQPYLECPAVQIERPEVIIGCLSKKDIRVAHRGSGMASEAEGRVELDEKKCKVITLKHNNDAPVPKEQSNRDIPDDEQCSAIIQSRKLESLFEKKKRLVSALQNVETNDAHYSQVWKPKGTLVAHMHEHRGAINKICVMPESLFATCSADGTVKIWDWVRMEKRYITNRSRHTYDRLTGELVAMDYCHKEGSLMVASNSGNIEVFRLETGKSPSYKQSRCLNPTEEGWAVDIKPVGGSVMAYASLYGSVSGWDLRAPGTAWRLENDSRVGLLTCMAIDNSRSWLATGTSQGAIVCWDLRFQLPIAQVQHPFQCRVYNLSIPKHSNNGSVWASHFTNNEVSLWNLETQQRLKTLWASNCRPFNDSEGTKRAMYAICQADQYMFTAGTDMRIRCWDVSDNGFRNSYIVAGSATDYDRFQSTYTSSLIDGTEVVQESLRKFQNTTENRLCSRAAIGHHNCITDLAVIKSARHFLMSASKDGVVKIWK